MTQQEFRIDVGQGRISYSYGYAGDEPEEERKDIDLPIDNLTLQTAKLLEGWLNVWDWIGLTNDRVRKILLTSATFRVVGKHLWMLILDNEVGAKLLEKIPTSPDSPLRVVINFDQASSDIRGLPWEFLCTPDPEIFLAAATNLLLTRLAPQSAFPRNQVEYATNRLGVLFVTALPGLKMYDRVNDRVRSFQNELMKQPGLDVLELIDELEVDRIEAALSDDEHPCHVVHITGLCRGDPGQPQLWMEGVRRARLAGSAAPGRKAPGGACWSRWPRRSRSRASDGRRNGRRRSRSTRAMPGATWPWCRPCSTNWTPGSAGRSSTAGGGWWGPRWPLTTPASCPPT